MCAEPLGAQASHEGCSALECLGVRALPADLGHAAPRGIHPAHDITPEKREERATQRMLPAFVPVRTRLQKLFQTATDGFQTLLNRRYSTNQKVVDPQPSRSCNACYSAHADLVSSSFLPIVRAAHRCRRWAPRQTALPSHDDCFSLQYEQTIFKEAAPVRK